MQWRVRLQCNAPLVVTVLRAFESPGTCWRLKPASWLLYAAIFLCSVKRGSMAGLEWRAEGLPLLCAFRPGKGSRHWQPIPQQQADAAWPQLASLAQGSLSLLVGSAQDEESIAVRAHAKKGRRSAYLSGIGGRS